MNTRFQKYNVTNKQMTHQRKKNVAVKKILVREKKKREISNKVYNFFSSNLCLMFDLSNKGKMSEKVMGTDW